MPRATPLRDGPGPALTLHFDGAPISADPRDTVASALIAAGELMTSRSAKYRRPRGAYCLLGDCGTCLVRIDGQPNVRACLTPVRPGMQVTSQNSYGDLDPTALIDAVFPGGIDHHHLVVHPRLANSVMQGVARNLTGFGVLPDHPPAGPARREDHSPEVLIIGAGRSGRIAADLLLAAGLDVLLLDRRDLADLRAWDPAPLPTALRPGIGVFAAYPHEALWAAAALAPAEPTTSAPTTTSSPTTSSPTTSSPTTSSPTTSSPPSAASAASAPPPVLHIIRPRHVILALGAHIPTVPVPGNDLPGVVSARGLRHLLARTGRSLAGPVIVIGTGPAAQAHADALSAPLIAPADVRRIVGRRRVKAVETTTGRLTARLVALAPDPAPAFELAAQAGAALRWTGRGFAPVCDPEGRVQQRAEEHPLADDPPAPAPWTLWATGALGDPHSSGERVAAALLRQLGRATPGPSPGPEVPGA